MGTAQQEWKKGILICSQSTKLEKRQVNHTPLHRHTCSENDDPKVRIKLYKLDRTSQLETCFSSIFFNKSSLTQSTVKQI